MKKLMTLMLGAAIACGTVTVTFAQEKKEEKKAPAKKKGKKKEDTKKKDGNR